MFTSALAKVSRAEEQAVILEREIDLFFAEKTYEIEVSVDRSNGRKSAWFHVVSDPPYLRWAIMIGEIFHNLRSALDHAITDLTVAETGLPLDGTEFPIFEDEAKYLRTQKGDPARGSGLYKIRGVSSNAKTIISWLQPFEVRKRNPNSTHAALSYVHALNIIDKHRTVHLVRARVDETGWRATRDFVLPMNYFHLLEVKDGAKIAEWTTISPEGEMDVKFHFKFFIAFGDNGPELANLLGANIIKAISGYTAGVRWILGRLSGDTTTPAPH
jgi:hypothetical protein